MSRKYKSKSLDHLGLVAGMIDELEIKEVIDENINLSDSNRKVSTGECVKAFVLIGLGFMQRALYITPNHLKTMALSRLFNKEMDPEWFNDDVMGRTLDRMYEAGTTSLFSKISTVACGKLNLKPTTLHIDSTSIHTDGNYNFAEEEGVIKIVKGYSRDHRPELNQVILNMIVDNKSGIPLLMSAASGNSSDKTDFPEIIDKLAIELTLPEENRHVIADSALYTLNGLQKISEKWKWISRVPETLKSAKEVIKSVNISEMTKLNENYHLQEIESKYAGIDQRWAVIYSKEAHKMQCKTLIRNLKKKSDKELKSFKKLKSIEYACETDAWAGLEKATKSYSIFEILEPKITKTPKYKKRGAPQKGSEPDFYIYQITGNFISSLPKKEEMEKRKGFFILATNEMDKTKLKTEEILSYYKDQGKVERGFRFIKDPQFMASTVFLKNPKRIEALMMIMTLSLLVYAALEHKTRERLKEKKVTFPNQIGKQIENPTMRWIFQCFKGIDVLNIEGSSESLLLNMEENEEKIITLLGENYVKIYF